MTNQTSLLNAVAGLAAFFLVLSVQDLGFRV